jgi:hypothetical protein
MWSVENRNRYERSALRRSRTALTSSLRVAMLTRLAICRPVGTLPPVAFWMRQRPHSVTPD